MRIKAGDREIIGVEAYAERVWHEGAARPALRLELAGGLGEDELAALTAGDIAIVDEAGVVQGTWRGYNAVVRHELVLAQVTPLEQAQSERDAALHEASHAQAEAAQVRAAAADMVPLMRDSAALINAALPLIAPWQPGRYAADDVREYQGAPYRCIQAHDSGASPDWTPAAAPALWAQYHGTGPDSARPYVAPSGAQDMYRAGEWALWEGAAYRCTADTAYSPGEYPAAWEAAQ